MKTRFGNRRTLNQAANLHYVLGHLNIIKNNIAAPAVLVSTT